ncbi:MAG: hypothetical protein ABF876_03300 [Acetobacter aceti]|nr:hypothetical protein [Acetobacter aceti]
MLSIDKIRVVFPIALLLFAIICRGATFGSPFIHIDEQFYMFTGGRILHGDLPYVQIWDRKPLGLFLLYAFFHLFGPWRFWAYQIGALLSVWGTALLLMRMASTIASRTGAFVAALLYINWLNLAGGEGGQSPVFYNLLVIAAMALVLFRVVLVTPSDRTLRNTGCQAMLLIGLALQIKYTAVFEGMFLGIFLLCCNARVKNNGGVMVLNGFLWCMLALLPTVVIGVVYYAGGYGHDWWFANIESIFLRGSRTAATLRQNKIRLLLLAAPLVVVAMAGCGYRLKHGIFFKKTEVPALRFLSLWALSACIGVAVFGGWYKHYALPLFPPLILLCAPLWDIPKGRIGFVVLLLIAVFFGQKDIHKHMQQDGDMRVLNQMIGYMSKPLGCTFVYQGPVILYDVLPWCGLTTHPFPGHFNEYAERQATGIDPQKELQHVLAASPEYVVTEEPAWSEENLAVRSLLYKILQSRYHEYYKRKQSEKDEFLVVYKLNDGNP